MDFYKMPKVDGPKFDLYSNFAIVYKCHFKISRT